MLTRFRIVSLCGAALATVLLTGPGGRSQDRGPEPLPSQPPPVPGRAAPPADVYAPPAGYTAPGTALPALPADNPAPPAAPEKAPDNGMIVQARGPVHEAFAQPYSKNPEPTPLIPRKPPEPIPEEPPDQKPQGDNVQWIPGYWGWDVDRKDFVWVSGFWRVAPPDRQWVPGYWTQADGGWRWVAGYWGLAGPGQPGPNGQPLAPDRNEYLPPPPGSLDNGPSIPAPDDNCFYVPGCWLYRDARYAWRPGFWSHGYEDWVWNPPCYAWTPAGCVYVDGYWDYPLADRGLPFAPVSFTQALWTNPGWSYQPDYVVNSLGQDFLASLFVAPSWRHYFFGNYYSPFYAGLGFYPWWNYGLAGLGFGRFGYGGFDPLFGYHYWWNHGRLGWVRGLRDTFLARRNGLAPVPANTLAGQLALGRAAGGGRFPRTLVPLGELRNTDRRLAGLDRPARDLFRNNVQQFRSVANTRLQSERVLAAGPFNRFPRQNSAIPREARSATPFAGANFGDRSIGRSAVAFAGRGFGDPSFGRRSGVPFAARDFSDRSFGRSGALFAGRNYGSPGADRGRQPDPGPGAARRSFYSNPSPGGLPQELRRQAMSQQSRTGHGFVQPHGELTQRARSLSHAASVFRSGAASAHIRPGASAHGSRAPASHGGKASAAHRGGGTGHGGGHASGGHGGGGHKKK